MGKDLQKTDSKNIPIKTFFTALWRTLKHPYMYPIELLAAYIFYEGAASLTVKGGSIVSAFERISEVWEYISSNALFQMAFVGYAVFLAVKTSQSLHKSVTDEEEKTRQLTSELLAPIHEKIEEGNEFRIFTNQYIECEKYLKNQEKERAGLIHRLNKTIGEVEAYEQLQFEYANLSIPKRSSYILKSIGLTEDDAPASTFENDYSQIDMKDYGDFADKRWIMELEIIYQKYKKVVEVRKADLESKLKI